MLIIDRYVDQYLTQGRAQLICKKHSDFDSCEECVRFNRPCFVTPTEHLLGNDQLREALNGPKMRGQTAEIIEDPNIVASGADDEADDEAEEE